MQTEGDRTPRGPSLGAKLTIESVLGGGFEGLGRYLPYTAATTIAGSRLGGGDVGFAAAASASPLPHAAAAALVLCLTLALTVIAALTTVRRDVT